MTPEEKRVSFYNRYFVFKKVRMDAEDVTKQSGIMESLAPELSAEGKESELSKQIAETEAVVDESEKPEQSEKTEKTEKKKEKKLPTKLKLKIV